MQERSLHDNGHPGESAPPKYPCPQPYLNIDGQDTASSPRDVPGPKAIADLSAYSDGSGGARLRSDREEGAFDDDGSEALDAARLLGGLSATASAWPVNGGCMPAPCEKTAKFLHPSKKRKNEAVSAARIFFLVIP